jgi:shikimate dehydrogenase
MTDQYAVIGHPIAHSKSPQIHARFAAQTGQDLRYAAMLAPLDGFAATVRDFAAAGGRGANVTVPFKEEAFRLATRLSPRAQAAGAVNTLSFSGAEIFGDNTDGAGLVRDIAGNLVHALAGQRILLLGAGGAARGVILPLLLENPARLVIANRTAQKAVQLAAEFSGLPGCALPLKPEGCGFADVAAGGSVFDIVINATSAGLHGNVLAISDSLFAPGALAYEMVYGRDTPFMAQARRNGAQVADGLGMLVEQAAEAFLLWRGVRPDTAQVLQELRGA